MALPRVVGLGFCVFLVGIFIFSITTIFRVYQLLFKRSALFLEERGDWVSG